VDNCDTASRSSFSPTRRPQEMSAKRWKNLQKLGTNWHCVAYLRTSAHTLTRLQTNQKLPMSHSSPVVWEAWDVVDSFCQDNLRTTAGIRIFSAQRSTSSCILWKLWTPWGSGIGGANVQHAKLRLVNILCLSILLIRSSLRQTLHVAEHFSNFQVH
jgi:hypothetical protein